MTDLVNFFQVLKSQQPNSSAAGVGYGSSRRGKPSLKNGRPNGGGDPGGTGSRAEEIHLVPSSSANGKLLDTRACVQVGFKTTIIVNKPIPLIINALIMLKTFLNILHLRHDIV